MRGRLAVFRDIWDPSVRWGEIGVIALVAGVISAIVTTLFMMVVLTAEEETNFDYYTLTLGFGLFWFWLWSSGAFLGTHFLGLMDLARSLFREC